ncbi:MAG: spermidine/putrescine ABC transporter substrate-binding protein [Clostridia bacterium]|nr:spermidine/putrescine ABC transporter substrate-binding protein [Clostridia bacterium]
MTKKIFSLLLTFTVLALSALTFTACSGGNSESEEAGRPTPVDMGVTKTLNVYNWGEYISDGFEGSYDSNAEFEYYFNVYLAEKYGYNIKVNYTTYATNEDMYSKIHSLMSSGSGDAMYDIVVPSDYMIQQMIEADMLLPFDAESIPNYKNISDSFKSPYYDPENLYSVPYTYGMVGIIYNPGLMNEEDLNENGEIKNKSWDMLWCESYKGKILQFNNPRDAFGTAMYKNNLDINSTDPAVWQAAAEELKLQKPLVQGYVNDEIFNKMTTASATLAPYFAGDFITMYDSLPEDDKFLKFYYPDEGTNVFIDAMCILKTSKMQDAAKEYINFMLDRDAAVANALYIGYASPNEVVRYDEEYLDEMGEDAIEILYGADPELINEKYSYDPYYHKLDTVTQENFYALWESLKTENAIEPWVHVSSITIVAVLLFACVSSTVIKKKRSKFYRERDKELKKKRKA